MRTYLPIVSYITKLQFFFLTTVSITECVGGKTVVECLYNSNYSGAGINP